MRRTRRLTVERLLWEVHRLRAVVLRANDLVRAIDYNDTKLDPASGLALKSLHEALEGEPVVQEDATKRIKS